MYIHTTSIEVTHEMPLEKLWPILKSEIEIQRERVLGTNNYNSCPSVPPQLRF
jgi:hypothetical protein